MNTSLERIIEIIKNFWKSWLLFSLLFGAISFLFFVMTQKNFQSQMDLLVIQNQNGFSDYYALSKSADFLSGVLVESIYSEKFLEEMETTGLTISAFLPQDKSDRLKTWKKMVYVSKNSSLGMVNIKIMANSKSQLQKISETVLEVLTKKNYLFLGKGQDLDVRVLNSPIIEKNPTVSQMIFVYVGGFFVGGLLFLIWAFYREISFQNKLFLQQEK